MMKKKLKDQNSEEIEDENNDDETDEPIDEEPSDDKTITMMTKPKKKFNQNTRKKHDEMNTEPSDQR